ncbi:MAG: dihydrolipoyl dehydrogenase, partial [Calditrichaeota bacterium]|nr:dihydrolipoyl dehydrogenase [Calditrichota bacterium]
IGKFPFVASGKARAAGDIEGFVKIICDAKSGRLLGAHMIGAEVTELIAELSLARTLGLTGKDILRALHPHPTLSEAVMEATAAGLGEAIHL